MLRWGICGAGKISHDFVLGLKTRPTTEQSVVAVSARSAESAAEFASRHRVKKYYGSYEELALDHEVDVVYVGTIHPAHYSCVKLMLEKGKSVVCENPLTMNVQDTLAVIEMSKDRGLFLMEGMWTRFFPAVVEMRRRISNGDIGEVKSIQANIGFRRRDFSGKSRHDNPELGGGAVITLGVYPLNVVTMVFGERPSSIHATGWLTSTGVDEFASIILKYSGQRVAQVSCSVGVDLINDAVVYGTKGKLKLLSPFWCPVKLETAEGVLDYPPPDVELAPNFMNSGGFGYEAEHVRKCLQAGLKQSDMMPLEHTVIVAEIMETVMKQLGTVHFAQSEK